MEKVLLAIFLFLPISDTFAKQINISPDQFKSKRAKIIRKALNNNDDFNKALIDTINNSREPLMCKLEVHYFSKVHFTQLNAIAEIRKMGLDLTPHIKEAEYLARFHLNEIDRYCN